MARGSWYVLAFPNATWGIYRMSEEDLADIFDTSTVTAFKLSGQPPFRTSLDQLDISRNLNNS